MENKNNSKLFYTCSLIEYIGRKKKRNRQEVLALLGEESVKRIYEYSDVFHCEPIEKVADDFIEACGLEDGSFDNVKKCKYRIPDYWTIGEVYERLIEDCYSVDDVLRGIWEVYHSWISESISDYNTDFYFQPRDYIAACYKKGMIL